MDTEDPNRVIEELRAALGRAHAELEQVRDQRDQLESLYDITPEARRQQEELRAYITKLETLLVARTELLQKADAELIRQRHDLKRSYDITLEALGDALDLKDAETAGHFRRVTAFTIAIARAMELPAERVRVIARAAFLHDVGMLGIPDAILRKPGRLTPEEQMVMRSHALLGYRMLRKIPFLREAAEIVRAHHEHWDGSGYPRGLKGDHIPLGARIVAVAETMDAITSDKPYRAAQSVSPARDEILRCSGRQFDPEVVQTFLSISEELWQTLRREVNAKRSYRGPD